MTESSGALVPPPPRPHQRCGGRLVGFISTEAIARKTKKTSFIRSAVLQLVHLTRCPLRVIFYTSAYLWNWCFWQSFMTQACATCRGCCRTPIGMVSFLLINFSSGWGAYVDTVQESGGGIFLDKVKGLSGSRRVGPPDAGEIFKNCNLKIN